jgi:hypothetical protein
MRFFLAVSFYIVSRHISGLAVFLLALHEEPILFGLEYQ